MQFAINIRWDERTMKILFRTVLKFAPVLLLLIGGVATTMAQGAKLQLDQLDLLANRASETVDVKLDEHLMQTAAKLFSGKAGDDAEIRELIKNVKGIYVKSFSFDKENEYSPVELDSVLSQLRGGGWSKIVGVKSKKDGENVEVYLLNIGDQIGGLAVVSIEPKEFTVVNIVGPINLEKLSQLEGSFGVPYLNLPPAKPKTDK
ncbi:MAG TPA: hypothetical protein DC054_11675 [Blastocatellia bacterium]|nr:hypothetical protein [Blastocatellia bacterium]